MSSRPRVALVAYAASPYRGSEEGVGWNRAVEISKYCDVTVFCEELAYRGDIERWMDRHGRPPGLAFHFLPKSAWEQRIERLPRGIMWAHHFWQQRVARVVASEHENLPFDLTHHLTYCSYREPGGMWKLDVPFFWGPVGGSQNTPTRFLPTLGWKEGTVEAARSVINWLTLLTSRRLRRAARRARVLFAANSTNLRDLRRHVNVQPRLLFDTGVPRLGPPKAPRDAGPLRIVWCGRFIPTKAAPLLLRALARMGDAPWELKVLGDGPRAAAWRRLAVRLLIDDRIDWRGRTSHETALEEMGRADLLVFTSLRDTGGCVILEAMSMGTPVVCLDHQGAQDLVTEECGVKIPPTTPEHVVDELAAVLRKFALEPELLAPLGQAARARAGQLSWKKTSREIVQAYESVLGCRLAQRASDADDQPRLAGAAAGEP